MGEDTGPSEEEMWSALEDLYREGYIEHTPGIGEGAGGFALNDCGAEHVKEMIADNDDMVVATFALCVQAGVEDDDIGDIDAVVEVAMWMRRKLGVNPFRSITATDADLDWIDVAAMPDELVALFDP